MNRLIKSIVNFSLKNRFLIFFIALIWIVAGVHSIMNTPIEAFPDVTNTNVVIVTQWQGRSAEEMERLVTIPIETEMNVIPKKTSLRSISLFGLSYVTIIFDDDAVDFNSRMEVANHLTNVDLPDGAVAEIQPPSGPTGEIYRYTLSSATKDVTELKTIQDWVLDKQFKSVPGIADVVSFGGKIKTIEVSLHPSLLSKYGFTAFNVFDALSKSNINVGGDVIKKGNQAIVVRGIGLITRLDEVENIIIDNVNSVPIKIKDVGAVKESSQPRLGIAGRDEKDDVVEGIVLMRKNENVNEVINALEAKVEELNDRILPSDVSIDTFYNRKILNTYTMETVSENVVTGISLVTLLLLLFLADWRTTVTVAIIIPMALLFAFTCIHLKGMTANLLSIGAIDFGIIIDGAVVMVEGIFVVLAHKANQLGMFEFNKRAKLSTISKTAVEMGRSIFTSKIIIITALLPIFSFQKVEGKLFSPLAYTMGFALVGALILSLTLVPLLISILLRKNVRERENPLVNVVHRAYTPTLNYMLDHPKKNIAIAFVILVVSLFSFRFIGSEFLPHLNEGSIYVRASMPMSISLDESYHFTRQIRSVFRTFPEVRGVMSQTGRPNDGTDPTGFFNAEFFVDLYPEKEWKRRLSKDELITEMQNKLTPFKGVVFNFSQPISDNVEEAVSGVKGSMAIKIFGADLEVLQQKADSVYSIMKNVSGVEDLGIFTNLGQPEFRIILDQQKMAVYNVSTEAAQAVIEMAVGGKTVSQFFDQEKKFDIRVRYDEAFRYSEEQIGNLYVPTRSGEQIPLKEIATLSLESGVAFVYREWNQRFIALKFSVRGRDLGSTIKEAQQKVEKNIQLAKGYSIKWAGEFENQERATKRLAVVVPISIGIIFLILLFTFGNAIDASLIILNVPFALIGGIFALLFTGVNFSISAGVGFIALFGVATQDGVILVNRFKENIRNGLPIKEAVRTGALSRVRPVIMTALMASLGLMPAAISTGIGSETQKPLAIVVIGGLITATLLSLLILPTIFNLVYGIKEKSARQQSSNVSS